MKPVTKINISLISIAILGIAGAYLYNYEVDPLRPYLLLILVLIVAKLNLKYFLGLKMSFTHASAEPTQTSERKRLLFASWLIASSGVYLAVFEL